MASSKLSDVSRSRSDSGSSPDLYLEGTCILPTSTSRWNVTYLERLGVYYNDEYHSSPSDILDYVYKKSSCFGSMNGEQKRYIDALKDQFVIDFSISDIFPTEDDDSDDIFDKVPNIATQMNRQLLEIRKFSPVIGNRVVPSVAEELIQDLTRVLKYELASADVSRYDQGSVPEDLYVAVFKNFVKLCGLDVLPGSLWKAAYKRYTSITDLLLLPLKDRQNTILEETFDVKSYMDVTPESRAIVSVLEVKNSTRRKLAMGLKTSTEARMSRNSLEASSPSCHRKHSILENIDISVLGKHGGELIMYRKFYAPQLLEKRKMFFPGMLVIGTEVIFTLLETDTQHIREVWEVLQSAEENVGKKAKIYYSRPKDILKKEDRDQLMEAVMRLNNVE